MSPLFCLYSKAQQYSFKRLRQQIQKNLSYKSQHMKYFLLSIISFFLSTMLMAQVTDNQSKPDAGIAGTENIQHVLVALSKAWNLHDAHAFSMAFAEDADFTNVRGMGAHSRAGVEKFHEQPFATWFKESNLKITSNKVRFIKPDVAAVDAWWEMTGAKTPDGKDIPLRKGLLNFIMTMNGDKWLITVMHNMDLPVI
jgi:uncharacterized protein (TIGR02246 family)